MMRNFQRILICTFLFSMAGGVRSQTIQEEKKKIPGHIQWYSFEKAYELNKKKPRKMLVDVYTDWCGWCKKMDAETFSDPVIMEYMQKHFYSVKLNAETKDTITIDGVTFINPGRGGRRQTHQLASELLRGNMSYPSYVFLNEKGQLLTVVQGYQASKEFESVLHYFGEDAYLKNSWAEFQSGFKGKIK